MGALCYAMLLLAACLHCANSSATTVKEGEKKPADCSTYIIRPEDIEKMGKCVNLAIIEQIINNITNATNEKINAMEKRVRQLEKTVNSSQVRWQHICHQDCLDWRNNGFRSSGIYQVCPGNGQPIVVYCDMETDGGGWVVFQRRVDGSTSFAKRWLTYKQGFGDLNGDFWLGFEKIRRFMTVQNKLRIDLVAYENIKGYGKYNNFHIGDEDTYYTLNVSDFTGNITDRLNDPSQSHRSSGAPFSTYDQDHDNDAQHCAQEYDRVGYWYNLCDKRRNKFPYTMLNGAYQKYGVRGGSDENHAYDGIYWYGWPSSSQYNFRGLTETKMMFRRKYI